MRNQKVPREIKAHKLYYTCPQTIHTIYVYVCVRMRISTHTCAHSSLFFSLQYQLPPKEQLQAMQVWEPEFRLRMPMTPALEGRDSQFPRVCCPVSQPRRFKLQASSSLRNPVSIKQRVKKEDAWGPTLTSLWACTSAHTHYTHHTHKHTEKNQKQKKKNQQQQKKNTKLDSRGDPILRIFTKFGF